MLFNMVGENVKRVQIGLNIQQQNAESKIITIRWAAYQEATVGQFKSFVKEKFERLFPKEKHVTYVWDSLKDFLDGDIFPKDKAECEIVVQLGKVLQAQAYHEGRVPLLAAGSPLVTMSPISRGVVQTAIIKEMVVKHDWCVIL